MSRLEQLKKEVRELMQMRCFVQRSRTDNALLVTDAPRRSMDSRRVFDMLSGNGWTVTEQNGLYLLDLSKKRYEQLFLSLPPPVFPPFCDENAALLSLCTRLVRHPVPAEQQPIDLIRKTLILLDANNLDGLLSFLLPQIAVLQRTCQPLPTACANLILEKLHQ